MVRVFGLVLINKSLVRHSKAVAILIRI